MEEVLARWFYQDVIKPRMYICCCNICVLGTYGLGVGGLVGVGMPGSRVSGCHKVQVAQLVERMSEVH